MIVNILVFAAQLVLEVPFGLDVRGTVGADIPGGFLTRWLAFQPLGFLRGQVWKPLTYMFLHADLTHLFMNMLWLFFFGTAVERALGTRQFIRFYLICGGLGVLATFVRTLTGAGLSISVVGASGAVMGVLVAFAMVDPERRFFLFPLPIPINARALVLIVVVMNVFSALRPDGHRSVATHFGGMLAGYAYMKLVPMWTRARAARSRRRNAAPEKDEDALKEAVDNIFRLEDRDQWRRR